jgi:hypothetical protein
MKRVGKTLTDQKFCRTGVIRANAAITPVARQEDKFRFGLNNKTMTHKSNQIKSNHVYCETGNHMNTLRVDQQIFLPLWMLRSPNLPRTRQLAQ